MTMTTAEVSHAPENEFYDSEDGRPRDSPPLKILRPKLAPTPSPPPDESDSEAFSPPGSPKSRKLQGLRKKKSAPLPSQGDAVLLNLLGGGKTPEVARKAAVEILPSGSDDEMMDASDKGVQVTAESLGQSNDLLRLAAGALQFAHTAAVPGEGYSSTVRDDEVTLDLKHEENKSSNEVPAAIKRETMDEGMRHTSPNVAAVDGVHELAPIQERSPKSEQGNGLTLPSISAQLGDISELKVPGETSIPTNENKVTNGVHRPSFSQSPPQPPLFQVRESMQLGGHTSPPISPNEIFRRELPSPGRNNVAASPYYYNHNPRRPSQASEGLPYGATPGDYSSSATETPSTDQSGSTPGGIPAGIDRMSIDGITNPQIGGFMCTYPGCTSQAFQTQYLLNSHANVHSSNRPHYCPVHGCPRSEGGKGFKRKNEMIRHGLVHESPGYVCPYCLDREHKYPRPDNLQRHVRVHHVDKDKDDPQLREVLAQRPEGPSRGRRRRGGTS